MLYRELQSDKDVTNSLQHFLNIYHKQQQQKKRFPRLYYVWSHTDFTYYICVYF